MQKTLKFYILIITVLLFIIQQSCTKDESVDIPKIEFVNPLPNMTFSVGDTIAIKVKVESKSKIKSVEFKIYDQNNKSINTINSYVNYSASDNSYNGELIVSDKYLPSDYYNLICVSYNQVERKQKDIPIIINGLTKELLELALVYKNGIYSEVNSISPNLLGDEKFKFRLQANPVFTEYLPFHNRFAISANIIGDLEVWDYLSEELIMSIAGQANPPSPYFTGVADVDDYLAVMYYNEKVELYTHIGNIRYTMSMNSGYYAERVKNVGEYYAVIEKNKYNNNDYLSFRYKSTGAQYASFQWGNDVVDIFNFDNNSAIVFLNKNGVGTIGKYIFGESGYSEPVKFNGGEIKEVCQIDQNNYVFITNDNMYWYQYQSSSITPFATPNTYSKMKYDVVNQNVYAASGNEVFVFVFPSGNLQSSRIMSREILNFHLVYNL